MVSLVLVREEGWAFALTSLFSTSSLLTLLPYDCILCFLFTFLSPSEHHNAVPAFRSCFNGCLVDFWHTSGPKSWHTSGILFFHTLFPVHHQVLWALQSKYSMSQLLHWYSSNPSHSHLSSGLLQQPPYNCCSCTNTLCYFMKKTLQSQSDQVIIKILQSFLMKLKNKIQTPQNGN